MSGIRALGLVAIGACIALGNASLSMARSRGRARIRRPRPAPELARYIDHTLLRIGATRADLEHHCAEAKTHGFASVCVTTDHVMPAREHLRDSPVKVCAVVGFPTGAVVPSAKAFEARIARQAGADEIDMVMNLGAFKDRDYRRVVGDIRAVVHEAAGAPVKVILETDLLDERETTVACRLAKLGGAAFVKTCTGTLAGGATMEDVALMKRIVGDDLEVKASGGIRTAADVRRMLAAGATRIGTSAGVAIVTGDDVDPGSGDY